MRKSPGRQACRGGLALTAQSAWTDSACNGASKTGRFLHFGSGRFFVGSQAP